MSGMYDEVKISAVKLTPHQHEERGPEVSSSNLKIITNAILNNSPKKQNELDSLLH